MMLRAIPTAQSAAEASKILRGGWLQVSSYNPSQRVEVASDFQMITWWPSVTLAALWDQQLPYLSPTTSMDPATLGSVASLALQRQAWLSNITLSDNCEKFTELYIWRI